MKIKLSEHFTYHKLLRFVFPSIVMMIFTSIYSVVDGLFVSNFVGKSAFAAVNLIMPFLMGISALGFMIGTGGSAIVAKTLGEGKIENANEYFSMLVYITAIGGIIIATLSMFLVKPVAILFGANGALLACYGKNKMNRIPFTPDQIRKMKCSAEIQEEQWNVNLALPIEILEQVYGKLNLQEGSDFRCNFYKICETKEYEHYAAYRCVGSEQPNFHLPEYFENAVILKRK